MPSLHVIAGRCRIEFDNDDETAVTQGRVLVLCKPDNTVLVHDADGYQPVAWLTRPAGIVVDEDRVEATDGDQRLRVDVIERFGRGTYPASDAGTPVGTCPACDGPLTRSGTRVHCGTCGESYGLPADATIEGEACEDCGLPRMTLHRGEAFTVCLDAACRSYVAAVREAFDRAWACPDCGADLRVLRRGGLLLGCDAYPDCETSFSFPAGLVRGSCDCGLPTFETATGERCLDTSCDGVAT
jgi:DNA topoisomerase-1